MEKSVIREETVRIPTYQIGEPEKSPLFIETRAYQGSTGKVYPLPVIEKISDQKEIREYKATILENDYLYVMILPELGGRIQRAYDKTNQYDFVYYNHVIKPALVGLAGPWISGGIEFNWPQHHRPSTFAPVEHSMQENADGSVSAYIGETDIMYGTKSLVRITLYPDKAYIEIDGQLYNPTDFPQTFLWWANPAVAVNDNTFSVFPPDVNAVMDHGKRAVSAFPIAAGEYYKVDYSRGVDISRYKNIPVPTSYMAAHSDFDFIGNYDEGRSAGMLHVADHRVSPGKKQWTWGCGDFGKMWDKNLTDEDGPYIELMTGVYTDNQPDFTWLKPHEEKHFTQYFMPYKTVGRVKNATKDIVIGADGETIKIYSAGTFPKAAILVRSKGREIYRAAFDFTPGSCFCDRVDKLSDYIITVYDQNGGKLCAYEEFHPSKDSVIPSPAEEMKKPAEITSLEELLLCGQHLEQYRHATYLPADYYLEGLRRDKTDLRLNDAYGLLLLRNGQIQESLRYFEAAIQKQTMRNPNPYSGECYYHLGLAKLLLEEYDKAYDAFFKATWSAETAANAFYHLACISIRYGDRKQALEFLRQTLIRNYHHMKARTLKAELMENPTDFLKESYEIDRLCAGIMYQYLPTDEFQKVIGDKAANYLSLALWYIEFGLCEKAAAILNLCPGNSPMVSYYQGYALAKVGKTQCALAFYEKAENCCPDYCFPNRLMEQLILIDAIRTLPAAPRAHYYLGNLLYDRKQYTKATAHWEQSSVLDPSLAMVWRNLSIAYYNKENQPDKALRAITRACRLEPENSRFLLEKDQLLARTEAAPAKRLAALEAHPALLEERDALCLTYIHLLNLCERYEDAFTLLSRHTFHVWEGGEGKVAAEYKTALFALCERAMAEQDYEKAAHFAAQTLVYPENLGEGKLFNVSDNRAYYYMAECYEKLGDSKQATRYYQLASIGDLVPAEVRYYNDQPSDYIYYIGLACIKLSQKEKAREAFDNLAQYGKTHLHETVGYDFFAVSLPEIEVYRDDLQKRNDEYCEFLMALAEKGLKEYEKA